MKRILAIMSINPDYIQFAIPQLKSILSQLPIPLTTLFKQQLTIQPKHEYQITHQTLKNFPYVTLNVPEYQKYQKFFQKACKQTIMLHKFVLLISNGKNYEQLNKNKNQQILIEKCRNWDDQVICDFISRNRVLGRTYQIDKINKLLGKMDIRGKIDLNTPNKRYQLVEDHIWYQQHTKSPIQSTIKQIFFGLQLCSNKINKAKFNTRYQLSNRIYLGPTSADNDLAFMMCNQAKITQNSFVLDPFVGTGGLIIPPASKGAIVFGCDLDMRVLNGYSVGRINKKSKYYNADNKLQIFTPKIVLNFQQYGFSMPNIFRMDSTKLAFKEEEIFDAIITDPPYGLRAMSRSVTKGTGKEENKEENQLKGEGKQLNQQNKVIEQVQRLQINEQINKQKNEQQQQNKQQQQQHQQPQQTNKKQPNAKLKAKKLNQKLKKASLPQQQKHFKQQITQKLNRQRIDNWDKFDKGKVQCTQRQVIFNRLIEFALKRLKPFGRLVMLYPIYQGEEYKKVQSLPKFEGFKVIDMSENKLSKNNSRILVTLQKLANK